MNAYIIGKSLVCNLGDTFQSITNKLKNLNQNNYLDHLKQVFKERLFYSVESSKSSNLERYHEILDKVIFNAIQDANLTKEEQEELHIFIGSTSMEMGSNEESRALYKENKHEALFKDIGNGSIGEYVEQRLNSKYKALLFTTACTSSVNALAYASKMIEQQQIKSAIVIGLELFNQSTYGGFSSLMLLSKNQVYRPFDKNSDGIILGEGCSAVILSSVAKTQNDFRYYSSANICDNYSETTSDPTGIPIFNTLDKCLSQSPFSLKDIDCIKAHATGSENNNSSEAKAIKMLFDKYNETTNITSLKPLLGHTLGACGTNEIVLMLYAIQAGFLPATLGFETPAEDVVFTPLETHTSVSNKAAILFNYVAFGGNNSSIIISNKAI